MAVGSELKSVGVRITDVQAPDQTPPDEGFKVIVEQDGEGLVGQKAQIFLEIQLPKDLGTVRIPAEAVPICRGSRRTPRPRSSSTRRPTSCPSLLRDKENPKQMVEGGVEGPGGHAAGRGRAVPGQGARQRLGDDQGAEEAGPHPGHAARPRTGTCSSSSPSSSATRRTSACSSRTPAGAKGEINLLDEKDRQLTHFPDRLVRSTRTRPRTRPPSGTTWPGTT